MPPTLFDPVRLGAIDAPNRILMAPMTRGRATRDGVPEAPMAQYYAQRASAGLILTEATGVSRRGLGWPYAPGIWNAAQVAGWREIVTAVHAAGGRIALQLWHMGRLVHPDLADGEQPISASATTAPGEAHVYDGVKPQVQARELPAAEAPALVDEFRVATRNALEAGFDGVMIHAANGYLIDQFLRDGTNRRTDAYGGSVENRIRLLDEITRAVVEVAGADRVSVRLSPNGEIQGVNDSDPETLFVAAAERLDAIGIAFLEMREPPANGTFGKPDRPAIAPAIRKAFSRPLVLNSDYGFERAQAALAAGEADAITFGRPFIANPDLPRRFQEKRALSADDQATWYTRGSRGYVDYPAATEPARAS